MDNTVAVALVAGMLGLFVLVQLHLQKSSNSGSSAVEAASKEAPATTAAKSKKKKPKKKKAAAVPEPEPEPEPDPTASTTASKKKKKKKKAAAATPAVETPAPAPVVEAPAPAPAPPAPATPAEPPNASGKKKKKKNKKNGAATATEAAAPTPATNGTSTATATPATPPATDEDDGFITIPKNNRKSKQAAAQAAAVVQDEGGGTTSTTLTIATADVSLLIGPKGATIQQLTADSGAKIDVDKVTGSSGATTAQVKVSGATDAVQAAVTAIQNLLADAVAAREAATAHSVTLSGATIKAPDGVKAIIGKGGATIKSIQTTTGCQLKASIDDGTVVITGPTADAVAQAQQLCKNAVFGAAQSQIDLQTAALVMAVCGKGFIHLRQMQDDSQARLDFKVNAAGKKTLLHISGEPEAVATAKTLIAARMALVAGTSLEFDASKTGAVYGKGGTVLRRIQDTSGATVEVMDATQAQLESNQGLIKILGEPAAVAQAKEMIMKALSGEVELKPGEVADTIDCGVGAAAVIGRGGSKIAELEKTHTVKLNVQSGSGECRIVGKPDQVAAAKTAIQAIVEPLIQKAKDEAEAQKAAEEMAAAGDDTWGTADGAGAWDDAVEENGW